MAHMHEWNEFFFLLLDKDLNMMIKVEGKNSICISFRCLSHSWYLHFQLYICSISITKSQPKAAIRKKGEKLDMDLFNSKKKNETKLVATNLQAEAAW